MSEVEWDESSQFGGTILELCSMCSSRGGIKVIERGGREGESTQALLTASLGRDWDSGVVILPASPKHEAASLQERLQYDIGSGAERHRKPLD